MGIYSKIEQRSLKENYDQTNASLVLLELEGGEPLDERHASNSDMSWLLGDVG